MSTSVGKNYALASGREARPNQIAKSQVTTCNMVKQNKEEAEIIKIE